MAQRFRAILLVLALAAPAYAQTTTTTGTPTTSTTILGAGCLRDLPLCRINSRLEALRDTVGHAWTWGGIGRPLDPIVFRLQRSSECLTRASGLCNGRIDTDENRARRQLRRCIRPLTVVLAKVRSKYGRRIIPPDLAAMIASEAEGLASDLEAARESLTCPPDTAVGRSD